MSIQEPTENETKRIRSEFDSVIVATSPGGGDKTLHIPAENKDKPACMNRRQHTGNSQLGAREVAYLKKDMACFPPGFYPWCKYCLEVYRKGESHAVD